MGRIAKSMKNKELNEYEKLIVDELSKSNGAYNLKNFLKFCVNTPAIPTGFEELDKALDGGLYEGLYIIGAISSLGKTTFLLQIADQIAQNGQDVLFFSLEMARTEIMAKSISRHTLLQTYVYGVSEDEAKTERDITNRERFHSCSELEKDLIYTALANYKEYAEHVYIIEGSNSVGVEGIRNIVASFDEYMGKRPVIFVDYLQILAPYNESASDKQNIDKAVIELKRISRDYKIPVISISSFNRASYSMAVTMGAFKESRAIEYSSDVLIGLQFEGTGENYINIDKAKKEDPRRIELVILKNRSGQVGERIKYEYFPRFNYFREAEMGWP